MRDLPHIQGIFWKDIITKDNFYFCYAYKKRQDQFGARERPLMLALPCDIMNEKIKMNQSLTLADLQNCGVLNF